MFKSKKNNDVQETGKNEQTAKQAQQADEKQELEAGLSNLYTPGQTETNHVRDIADVMLEMATLTSDQIQQIRGNKLRRGGEIESFILKEGFAESDEILRAKAKLYGFDFYQVKIEDVDKNAFTKLDIQYIRKNHTLPVKVDDGFLVIATSEPENVFTMDDIKRQTGLDTKVIVCCNDNIDEICDELDDSKFGYDVDEIISDMDEIELIENNEEEVEDLEKSAGESPVIKYCNFLIADALGQGASDIHIEPKESYTRVRYRIDGVLFDSKQAPSKMHQAIVSRMKIMSNLDISERRVPQDGKIAVLMGGRGIDLRVSVLPTSHGEKVVIRILDSKSIMRGLDDSGMEPDVLEKFREQMSLPNGIFLVTGPTGSGKSTTLYSALGEMDGNTLNVSTVEDPVEYDLEFANQIQVRENVGLTFALALRSLLRQDPDIMMIGEIRDNETARIAVQAALTGHLVLSTLHTNDAPSSVSRLVNIGIEPYLISASLNSVLAQRLVRKICDNCKENYKIEGKMGKKLEKYGLEPDKLVHGKGCDKCRKSGYVGRAGIFELLVINDRYRHIINNDSSVDNMRKAFKEEADSKSMFEDGIIKVRNGITTIEEVHRVTEVYGNDEAEEFTENENT